MIIGCVRSGVGSIQDAGWLIYPRMELILFSLVSLLSSYGRKTSPEISNFDCRHFRTNCS